MRLTFALGGLILLLASCTASVVVAVPPRTTIAVYEAGASDPTLLVSDLYYTSNYEDDFGRPVVCDNRQTSLYYGFSYGGDLASWTSSLVGEDSGQVSRTTDFLPSSSGVAFRADTVEVQYSVPAGTAPLSGQPAVLPGRVRAGSIVVTRPRVVGYTGVRLTVRTSSGASETGTFYGLPVVDNCPTPG